ncbi:DUF4367 domain-containing protein [Sporanaerobacter acetigenes]|uniref:DUF4367 domain-containing protein n=1 Tax=Sporanaerobacter acetigenes DSM 13106 TaxID=1123281 RepID=A0A1M5YTX7_9FIRM|nr:DUF4367 domain-containing protein [Sporanaerobacter acetigenes]SHI15310.1 protein of unknown function [Sporanaerobacter acetigenes DSM 13106]
MGNDEFLKIISSEESDDNIKNRMYCITYKALEIDAINVDTDLIDECIKTVAMIDDIETVSDKKILEMRKNVDQRYKQWEKSKKKSRFSGKTFSQIAACMFFIFTITGFIANANGYNIFKIISEWSSEAFYLTIEGEEKSEEKNKTNVNGLAESNIYDSIDEALKDIVPEPKIPLWIPDNFIFEYAEKTNLPKKTILALNYSCDDKELLIYMNIYKENNGDINDSALIEKDNTKVVVYTKNNINHYIMKNNLKTQGVWAYKNAIYTTCGDISIEETKKIIDSMYNN